MFSGKELLLQAIQFSVQGLAVISKLVWIEVQVKIHPPFFFDSIALIRPLLLVVPGDCLREDIQLQVAVIVFVTVFVRPYLPNVIFGKF